MNDVRQHGELKEVASWKQALAEEKDNHHSPLTPKKYIRFRLEPALEFYRDRLPGYSQRRAWTQMLTMVKSLETLELRVRAQVETANALAEALLHRKDLERVIYPGLKTHPQFALTQAQMGAGGTVMALDVGSKERAFRFMNALEIILISNNLGDSKSIITHPATTTHQRLPQAQKDLLGITSGLLRFSVGLESAQDLEADLMAALDAAGIEA